MWADLLHPGEKETGGFMRKICQPLFIAGYNFRLWRGNPRILVTFALTLIMSFLLTDKAVRFAVDHNTTMWILELTLRK